MPGALTGIVPRRLLVAVLLLGGVVIAGAGVTVVLLPHGDAGSPSSVPDHGSAVTFGGRAGFDVSVSDVHVPDTAGRVTLAVSFRNTSSSQQRADPQDFAFRDGSGGVVRPLFDATCPRWRRADLHPAAGASQSPRDADAQQVGPDFGPVPLCFSVAHPAARPTLVWDPDVGFLGTPVTIPLR